MFGILDHGSGQIRTRVEQVVLDLAQHGAHAFIRIPHSNRNPDSRVGFVTVGVGDEPAVVLRDSAEIAEPGSAVVTGAGVDAGQVNSHGRTVPGGRSTVPRPPMFSPSVLKLNPRLLTLSRVSERFVVTGGSRLSGEVAVGGAKNSVLKLMAAALLAEGTSTITNCPDILDVPLMA